MRTLVKRLMSLNLNALVQFVRLGPKGAWRKLANSHAVALIPEVTLAELVSGRPTITIDSMYSYFDGSLHWFDIVPLLAVLVNRAPKAVLEIGTLNGHTTRLLALNLPKSTIHTIDLPPGFGSEADASSLKKDDLHLIMSRKVGDEYRSDPSISNVVQHFGDTATWDFGNAQAATFFFIDGSHTYDYVRNDTEKALAVCRGQHATFVWHDCDAAHPGVVRWLRDMIAAGYPVKRIAGTNLGIMDTAV